MLCGFCRSSLYFVALIPCNGQGAVPCKAASNANLLDVFQCLSDVATHKEGDRRQLRGPGAYLYAAVFVETAALNHKIYAACSNSEPQDIFWCHQGSLLLCVVTSLDTSRSTFGQKQGVPSATACKPLGILPKLRWRGAMAWHSPLLPR